MLSRRLLSVLVVVPLLAVTACGGSGSDGSDAAEPVQSSTPSASATESAAPSQASPSPSATPLPTTTAEAVKLNVSVLGSSVAETAEEKAVVEAWMTYWDAASKTFGELKPAPGLSTSARGEPLQDALDYLDKLKSSGRRSVGWTRDHVLAVQVEGDVATIRDCAENFNFEVDADDQPVETLVPFYSIRGQLTKDEDRWIVTTTDTTFLQKDCRT